MAAYRKSSSLGKKIQETGPRPPKVFDFVCRQEYAKVLTRIAQNPDLSASCVVSLRGVKGSGKSCFLRALAILLISAQIPKVRILDVELPLVPQITAALYFAFSDDVQAVERIGLIDSPEQLDEFLKARVRDEKLCLLIDGAERYDKTHKDADDVAEARSWLDVFFNWSVYRFQTLSPNARARREDVTNITEHFNSLFTTEEYEAFLTTCRILGPMLEEKPRRVGVVEHLAGRHPMSLYLLEETCAQYVKTLTGDVSNKRKIKNPFAIAILKRMPGDEQLLRCTAEIESSTYSSPTLGHKVLADSDHWREVVWLFRQDEVFQSMRKQPDLVQEFLLHKDGQEPVACTTFIRELDLQMRLMRKRTWRTENMLVYFSNIQI